MGPRATPGSIVKGQNERTGRGTGASRESGEPGFACADKGGVEEEDEADETVVFALVVAGVLEGGAAGSAWTVGFWQPDERASCETTSTVTAIGDDVAGPERRRGELMQG
jgi:hypothetical protein